MALQQRIADGLAGKYSGLSNGLGQDINKYLYNLQKKTYYLLGGLSGAAKTTLADFMVLNGKKDADAKGVPFECFYWSYEIDKETKKLNWLSIHIFQKHGVILSPQTIGGYGELRLTEAEAKLVEAELPYIEQLFSEIKFRFETQNPTGLFHELWQYALANGQFTKEKYVDHENKPKERVTGYQPTNPNTFVLGVIDHIALPKNERNHTLKENIDKLSEYFILLRNLCHYSFIVVQQFNQGLNGVERMKFKGVDLSPQQNDFKDSSNPYTDADVVLGVMNPWKMDFKEYMGHNLQVLKERLRIVKIIKNRRGRDNVSFAFAMTPEAGSFKPLPKPEVFTMGLDRYENYL